MCKDNIITISKIVKWFSLKTNELNASSQSAPIPKWFIVTSGILTDDSTATESKSVMADLLWAIGGFTSVQTDNLLRNRLGTRFEHLTVISDKIYSYIITYL